MAGTEFGTVAMMFGYGINKNMKLNHPDFAEVTQKRNREQKTYPTTAHLLWCGGCDAQLVSLDQKCPNCGFKFKTGKRKKL